MISTVYIRIIIRELNALGIDASGIFANTGIDIHTLDTTGIVSNEAFDKLLCNALKCAQDPAFGLKFGPHCGVLTSGIIGTTAIAAPSLLEALRTFTEFSRAHASYIRLEITADSLCYRITAHEIEKIGDSRQVQLEVMMFILQNVIEVILGKPFTQGKYGFNFSPPSYQAQYQALLNSKVSYCHKATFIEIPIAIAKCFNPFVDHSTWQKGKKQIAKLMANHSDLKAKLYSRHILSYLHTSETPQVSIKECAASLFMSERTLARKLALEHASFRQLQEQVLAEQAVHYLTATEHNIETISYKLGYNDAANFRRAFKRWFKCSPQAYLTVESEGVVPKLLF